MGFQTSNLTQLIDKFTQMDTASCAHLSACSLSITSLTMSQSLFLKKQKCFLFFKGMETMDYKYKVLAWLYLSGAQLIVFPWLSNKPVYLFLLASALSINLVTLTRVFLVLLATLKPSLKCYLVLNVSPGRVGQIDPNSHSMDTNAGIGIRLVLVQ